MTDLHIPDISRYQATVDMSKVGPVVILRAHNGTSEDPTFRTRQMEARAHCAVRGFYGYVVADRDAATQGREFAAIVGKLQPGEFAACDLEVGDGDQSARAEAWCAEVDKACGGRARMYSSLAFRAAHLSKVTGRQWWIAAYRPTEPAGDHILWQHADNHDHPGIGPCDCSIYHGTVQQLHDLISPAPSPSPPAPLPAPVPTLLEDPMFLFKYNGKHYLSNFFQTFNVSPALEALAVKSGAKWETLPENDMAALVGK